MGTPVVAVVGPTAAGKSQLAIELAVDLGRAEVVNADAMQLYRGMDIGTAKVPEARRRVPHHLLDVLDVTQEASVAVFQAAARAVIDRLRGRGIVPILTGGSSLYVRAVTDRLDFPGTDPAIRARWTAELDRLGPVGLHRVLASRDPRAAGQILPGNGRRIVRALEVGELTGQPFRARMPDHLSIYDDLVLVGTDLDRETLDRRIVQRVDAMWRDGLVEEVRRLSAAGLPGSPTASRALGYAQVLAFLAGEVDEDTAREQTVVRTRAFARRQQRLFRRDPRVRWFCGDVAAGDLAAVVWSVETATDG